MPRMTSTSSITGTGFMKCMPMKRSGRFVAAASRVIEIEDVFEARIAPGRQIRVEAAEELLLDGLVLDDRLDRRRPRRPGPRAGSSAGAARGPRRASSAVRLPFGDLALEVLLDRRRGPCRRRVVDVERA